MTRCRLRSCLAAAGLWSYSVAVAAVADVPVGVLVSKDTVRMDSTPVRGTATVLRGHLLEPTDGIGELRLKNGSVLMATNSRIRAYENRADLETGKIQMSGSRVSASAGQILVRAAKGGHAIVDRRDSRIIVGSLRGAVDVRDQAGTLLAHLEEGNAVVFDEAGRRSGAGISAADRAALVQSTAGKIAAMSTATKLGLAVGLAGTAAAVPSAVVALRRDGAPAANAVSR